MVVAIKSYRIFDRKGGEKPLFYRGCGYFGVSKFTILKICENHSFTIYLQLVFDTKISTIITIKKNERMEQMKITYREVNGYLMNTNSIMKKLKQLKKNWEMDIGQK